ncbi:DMT family transporter [Nocardia araoensis]|uniref:DMT family transporter n=1 Tax=Nocardia araoensis TaxID=228600 RepID=UPI000310FBF6|nr:DMT family transporter [Nocardia araoensis]
MRLDRATWVLASVSAVWGASYTVTGWGLRELDVVTFNAIRFAAAAPLLLLLTLAVEGRPVIARRWWPRLALSAAIGIVAYQLAFSAAVALTTVTESAILIALSPLWTALLARLTGEPVRAAVLIGACVAMAGVILVVLGRGAGHSAPNRVLGDSAALAASALWGAYPVVTRPLLTDHSPLRVTAWASVIGAAILLLLPVASAPAPPRELPRWSGTTVVSLAFSVLAVTIYGLVAWYWGVRRVGSAQTMVFMFAVPVAAAVFAVTAGAERITWPQIAGAGLVLAALTYSQHDSKILDTGVGNDGNHDLDHAGTRDAHR